MKLQNKDQNEGMFLNSVQSAMLNWDAIPI